MGNTMGKKRKLGSASSAKWVKPESGVHAKKGDGLSPLGRSYSMPVHSAQTKSASGRHVVALTSSTYGILKVDDKPKRADSIMEENNRTSMTRGRSLGGEAGADMNFNFQEKLRKFDVPEVIVPRLWSDVDEIVTKLRPMMSEGNGKAQGQEVLNSVTEEEPETINMWELMEGLDDDRSPLPQVPPPSASPHAPKLGTVAKKVRSLSIHTAAEVDDDLFDGAALAETVKSELQTALETDTLIKGKYYTQSPFSTPGAVKAATAASLGRHGYGKENTPSSPAVQRDTSLSTLSPVKLNASANVRGLSDSRGNNNNIKSRGVFGSTPNKAGGGVVVESPKTPVKAIIENFGKASSGSKINLNSGLSPTPPVDVSPKGVFSRSSLSPRIALQHSRFENSYTSPSGFPTSSSSSDDSEDRQQIPPESPLFDPELLASFEKAIEDVSEDEWYRVRRSDAGVASTSGSSSDGDSPLRGGPVGGVVNSYSTNKTTLSQASPLARSKNPDSTDPISRKMSSKVAPVDFRDVVLQKVVKKVDPFEKFEKMCPPGGEDRVVIYVTSLRGIRKTFEDCSHMKLVIMGYRVAIDERDVSMHADFRQELKDLLGKPMPVPRLFIKGRYIGGAEEVSLLHEDGTLPNLLETMPTQTSWEQCDGCGGHRFVPCSECSGSCKVITEDDQVARCSECNENGLVRCPICV